MTDEEIETYYSLIPIDRRRRIDRDAVWHSHTAVFETLQQMRARLAISVLRDIQSERTAEVEKVVAKIASVQERISRVLMDCDFEKWQEYVKPDHDEWAASVQQLRKHGHTKLADEIGSLLITMRIIVHTERRL